MLNPPPSTLGAEAFVEVYGGVYEHSRWVAEAIARNGLTAADDDPGRLAERMAAIVDAASDVRKHGLLNAHPELAGKLAIRGELTNASRAEQASAGLDQCTPQEYARFKELNARYRERFGFPFIIAVRGLDRADILAALEARVDNPPETEFEAALGQVHRIACLRLEAMAK